MGTARTKTELISSLLILSITLLFTTTTAQTCRSHTFRNNVQFDSCSDLPVLNSFLYWTYDPSSTTASIAFRVTGTNSTNWIAWALNPNGAGMAGAQALVAYQNSTGIQAYTTSINSTAISTLTLSTLSFQVANLTATSEGSEMTIFATITPPSTTVNQVWQVGPLSGGVPAGHLLTADHRASTGSINFLSAQTNSSGTPTMPSSDGPSSAGPNSGEPNSGASNILKEQAVRFLTIPIFSIILFFSLS